MPCGQPATSRSAWSDLRRQPRNDHDTPQTDALWHQPRRRAGRACHRDRHRAPLVSAAHGPAATGGHGHRPGADARTAAAGTAQGGHAAAAACPGGRAAAAETGRGAQADDPGAQAGQTQAQTTAAQAGGEEARTAQGETLRRATERNAADQHASGKIGPARAGPVAATGRRQSFLGRRPAGAPAEVQKYPQSALNSGKEGMNRLRFVVDAQGNVLSYELVGRSGNANLDRATLDMIRNAQPLPKPPADMVKSGSIEIVAPFVYNIEKRRR